jgi:site-specific DNA-methyltransferase (adenine-specific)
MTLDLGTIHLMDCMEGMKGFPDGYFDLAVCDPPYGIGIGTMTYTKSCTNAKDGTRKWGHALAERRDYSGKANWDIRPNPEYFAELFRVSKRQIIWGGNYFSDLLPPSKSFIVWDKRVNDAMTNSFADCEYAWCSRGLGVARMFRYVWNGMIQGNMRNKEERFHPTQKPVALYHWIFSNYLKGGGRVIDTHAGSGSSLIAAHDLRVEYIGFEICPDYHRAAMQRYADHAAQLQIGI